MTLQSIHLLASRHRLATLIASGALLLAAAAPVAAHHPSSSPGHDASFSGALDSASDEVDGWQAGEFDGVRAGTGANAVSGSVQTEQNGTTHGTTPSKDQANDSDSAGAEDATDTESTTGGDFEHSGTSDHGRPHPEDGSDGSSTWQGSTPNG
ncbi:MAG: hypothetical protein ACHQCF_07915 [Solirubrobacterales bacterium]